MVLSGMSHVNNGQFVLTARNSSGHTSLYGKPNGELIWKENDLSGAAIVAKSLNINGYIKFANGLIMQWGIQFVTTSNTQVPVVLPISFANDYNYIVVGTSQGRGGIVAAYRDTSSKLGVALNNVSNEFVQYFAIGK